ncbi:MAG TPA: extracellular solute-binding protein [Acidimicrobiales bacterium]|nr:extracellular solute-binding protein [Acidimicrobiales bacterium]
MTMSRPRRLGGVLLALTVTSGLLVAAAATAAPAGASGGSLTVYSGQHIQTTQALVNAFEKKTGIKVSVRFDDEDVLANQLATEGSHSPADVFFTENSPPLQFLASKHDLARVKASTLAQTPSKYNSPKGLWAGVSARTSVMVYNPSLIKASQLPTSVLQLSQPQFKDKIALAGGETDFQPIVTSVDRTVGNTAALKWLEGLKANAESHQYPDNETVVDEVNRGQVALGLINQYYWWRMQAEIGKSNVHSALAYFAPRDPGWVIDVSGAGIMRSSQHQAEAQRFVAFLTSKAGQEIIAHSSSYEYPIASGVTTAAPETPFDQLQPATISIAQLGTGAEAIKLLQEAQLL